MKYSELSVKLWKVPKKKKKKSRVLLWKVITRSFKIEKQLYSRNEKSSRVREKRLPISAL